MTFTDDEIEYLREQRLVRLATVDDDGQPDVVPIGYEFDGTYFWIGGIGDVVLTSRKFRNVMAGHEKVALVVDDLVSFAPFVARGIRVYGTAAQPVERVGFLGPGHYIRITPRISWSWNLAGNPAGQAPAAPRRTVHAEP